MKYQVYLCRTIIQTASVEVDIEPEEGADEEDFKCWAIENASDEADWIYVSTLSSNNRALKL